MLHRMASNFQIVTTVYGKIRVKIEILIPYLLDAMP